MRRLRLGEILVIQGAIVQSQLDGMLDLQPKTDMLLGEMLIESGEASPQEVMQALEYQRRNPNTSNRQVIR